MATRKELTRIASAAEYQRALRAVEDQISSGQRAMLLAHYRAPQKTVVASDLAQAAGYKNFSGAVLQYGILGHLISEELGFVPTMMASGKPVWTSVLADAPRKRTTNKWQWTMRAQVAAALEQLGWVR